MNSKTARHLGAAAGCAAAAALTLMLGRPGGGAEGPAAASAGGWGLADPVAVTMNRAVALMDQYDYTGAAAACEEVLRLAPGSVEARLNLAIALFNRSAKGDTEAAAALLDGVLAERPASIRALYLRGILHAYSGEDAQAVPCFERVLEADPSQAHAWYLLARSKELLNQPCCSELERAIAENPNLVTAYYQLMRMALAAGDQEEAKRLREKFVQLRESPLAESVVMPQYRQLGPLALAEPLSAAPRGGPAAAELRSGAPRVLFAASAPLRFASSPSSRPAAGGGLATADVNGDGLIDGALAIECEGGERRALLLLGAPEGGFRDATAASGLAAARGVVACAFGDYDNDGKVDLYLACAGPNHLFRGRGDGSFDDTTEPTGTAGADALSVAAIFLDADHDSDLDLYLCNAHGPGGVAAANVLLNNNGDGTFSDITETAGVAAAGAGMVGAAPADLDGDRDADLVVARVGCPACVFLNDRLGLYHPGPALADAARGAGVVAQDFNGDGRPDLLLLPEPGGSPRLLSCGAAGALEPSAAFDSVAAAAGSWGHSVSGRVADIDLDGDLDIALFGAAGHLLLNDGLGRFSLRPEAWKLPPAERLIGLDLADMTGDGVVDLLLVLAEGAGRIDLLPTELTPPANWISIGPNGERGVDRRTRSPASGFGTRLELRSGLHMQVLLHTGLNGGPNQSQRASVFGLDGASRVDYLAILWPDGVTQSEIGLGAGTHYEIREQERKVSSCPVLFAWDGARFGFVSDFAGVGGLGYFVAPGSYAPPQVLEHVRIAPHQLRPRAGRYELRVCEPMEEVAYIDRLQLLAVDHPAAWAVYPDERLAVSGPTPTHRLLCVDAPVHPARAAGPDGRSCAEALRRTDRVYAYEPRLDRRYVGFAEPHALLLEFDGHPGGSAPGMPVYLFVTGSIEYPYSQTTYAAGQSRIAWSPMRVELEAEAGSWVVIEPDAGAPGGMGRTVTIDLTGRLPAGPLRLRISTNLEIYYDEVFLAADRGLDGVTIREVPMARAVARRLGFPLEYSPDGRLPLVYSYDLITASSSFKTPRGRYTRYGPVDQLLAQFDDRYVVFGTGDELALEFDAAVLPPLDPAAARSFILVSHAYCKDMDLYTAACDTVEPWPHRGMGGYPDTAARGPEADAGWARYHDEFNTRRID